jgi:LysM repeat protein
MAGRSPARFLAPLALVVFALALYIVVNKTTNDDGGGGSQQTNQPAGATPTPKAGKQGTGKKKKAPKTYTVKAGDTPSGIAEKVGIPLDEILKLNPDLDPQALAPGTELKLR